MTRRRLLLLPALLLLGGCFSTELYAPHGADVYLMSATTPTTVQRQWRTWFVVYGAARLDNTMPAETIAREHLTELRVIVEDNIPDAFIGLLYSILVPIGILPQTLVVSGNRAPK
jgi:hypothetical protein